MVMVSCGPGDDGVGAVDSSSGSEGSGPGATSSTSESSGVLPVWPEDSLGAFYLETSLPLGIVGNYVAALSNLELTPQGLALTHLVCDGDHLQEELAVMYDGPEAHVRPLPGDEQVMWRGGPIAAELVFRPGPTCDTLELELVEPAPGYPDQWRWHRGALVITDSCSDSDEEWAADVSPDVPTECLPAD